MRSYYFASQYVIVRQGILERAPVGNDHNPVQKSHLFHPRDPKPFGHQDIGKFPVGNFRETAVRLLALHVDQIQLLHADICVLMEKFVKLPDLPRRRNWSCC